MKKCLIITSYLEGNLAEITADFDADLILCADGGYDHASAAGITPHYLIGDLDSIKTPDASSTLKTIIYPSEKDDTDTGICLQTAIDMGCRDILIAGGLGGRLDHTISNIQLIYGKSHLADRITIRDRGNSCFVLNNSSAHVPAAEKRYLSLFSMSESCTGVTARGLKYPLEEATLKSGSTLGTSNEFTSGEAFISVADGILLVILSDEK